jgi:hypothetical protein
MTDIEKRLNHFVDLLERSVYGPAGAPVTKWPEKIELEFEDGSKETIDTTGKACWHKGPHP